MIRWNSKLDWFEIDTQAPVQRRREFSMDKAKLEALRMVAECVDEMTEAMYGHATDRKIIWTEQCPPQKRNEDPGPALVEATRQIAEQLQRLTVAMTKPRDEKDVSGTSKKGTVLLDKATGDLHFDGVVDHGEKLFEPGRSPRLPAIGEGTIAGAIQEGFTQLAGTLRAQMERGQFPDGKRTKELTPGDDDAKEKEETTGSSGPDGDVS